MIYKRILSVVFSAFIILSLQAAATVVVLGSSTAADGSGWVTKYRNFLQSKDAGHQVINLAKGGYNTYKMMPDDFTLPAGRENHQPDQDCNITKALTYNPDVIIINFPSNDYSAGISTAEQISNYRTIQAITDATGIKLYIATPQPTNFNANWINGLMSYMTAFKAEFESEGIVLDFWTTLANENNNLKEGYYKDDGQHLTDAGQTALFEIVRNANLLLSTGYDYEYLEPVKLKNPVYINFGSSDAQTPWNNTLTGEIKNVLDINSNKTNITIEKISGMAAGSDSKITNTQTQINMPDEVSKSFLFGSSEFGSSFRIRNLSSLTNYNITIFASVSSSENNMTEYSFTSSFIKYASINTSNNYTKTIKIERLEPDANGDLLVKIKAEQENTSADYYLSAMLIEPLEKSMVALDNFGAINISFGANGIPLEASWNNVESNFNWNTSSDVFMKNTDRMPTMVQLTTAGSWGGPSASTGMSSTSMTLDMPEDVSLSNFYGQSAGGGQLIFSGFDRKATYNFLIYAARSGSGERTNEFTLTGATTETKTVNVMNNSTEILLFDEISPNIEGKITIKAVNPVGASNYYYINALRIEENMSNTNSDVINSDAGIHVISKNGITNLLLNSQKEGTVLVQIFDMSGKLVSNFNTRINSGFNTIILPVKESNFYALRVCFNNETYTSKYIIQ